MGSIRNPADLTLAMAGSFDTSLDLSEDQDLEAESKTLSNGSKKPTLDSLPIDVLRTIFDALPEVSSACLGLTCSSFYPLHRAKYGTVKLMRVITFGKRHIRLAELLRDFFPGLIFVPTLGKHVTLRYYQRMNRIQLREARKSVRQIGWVEGEDDEWLD